VLTVSGELQYGSVSGVGAGKTVVLKNERGKCMDALGQVKAHSVFNLAKIEGNLLHGDSFNIIGLYSHSQPPTSWPGQHLHPRPLVRIATVF